MKKLYALLLLVSCVFFSCEDDLQRPTDLSDKEISYDIFQEAFNKSKDLDSLDLILVQRKDHDYVMMKMNSQGEIQPHAVYDKQGEESTFFILGIMMTIVVIALFAALCSLSSY